MTEDRNLNDRDFMLQVVELLFAVEVQIVTV